MYPANSIDFGKFGQARQLCRRRQNPRGQPAKTTLLCSSISLKDVSRATPLDRLLPVFAAKFWHQMRQKKVRTLNTI
jgi:hypothetical protein